jgi:hypothetical protein
MELEPPEPVKPITKRRNEMCFCTEDELMLKTLFLWWKEDRRKRPPIGAVGSKS